MPSYRQGKPDDGRALWADLRVCLHSIEAYALDDVDEVVIAWEGPWAPDGMPDNPKFRYLERPAGMDMAAAWTWAIEQTHADELIQMGDDSVLHPDTIRMLIEDVEMIRRDQPHRRIGVMGGRSNVVAGAQNIRQPNGGVMNGARGFTSESTIMETEFIFTVLAWYTRAAWEHVGRFPAGCIWGGDMLFSYDLKRLGYTNFISRAYMHHIGWRGSELAGGDPAQMKADGDAWLVQNRPDFVEYGVAQGYFSPDIYQHA